MRTMNGGFRQGNVLATSFTGTLSERRGALVERIPTPRRLLDWLEVNGFTVGSCSAEEFEQAHQLRESIHAAATAAALNEFLPPAAVDVINDCSAKGQAAAALTPEGTLAWRLSSDSYLQDSLAVVAADAISIIAGERNGRLALCASSTCRAAFFDTSQSRTRRWCDMNTCGNHQKKERLKANQHKHQR